jgi:cysteinyl-tRNA synthetase
MLHLYNTLTRQEESFAPARDNVVRLYACGPTVYARAHIGNFRTFVCLDVLRRTLKYVAGHDVHQAVNYTDVDDKTIAGAQEAGVPLREYTEPWIRAFREDVSQLGIEPPEETPRATDEANLRAMSDMILALERNGHTYRRDGSIYFRIASFPQYGRLAWMSTNIPKTTRATSCSGKVLVRASRHGITGPAPAVRDGTSNARPWRCGFSANRRSTFMPAASI